MIDITINNFFLIKVHLIKNRFTPPSCNNNNPNEINYCRDCVRRLYSEVIGRDMKLCLYDNIWPIR